MPCYFSKLRHAVLVRLASLTASSSQCSLCGQSQHVCLVVSKKCPNTEMDQVDSTKTRQGGRADSSIAACGSERRPSRHGGA